MRSGIIPGKKIELALICTENRHSSSKIAPKGTLIGKLNTGAHPGKIMKNSRSVPAGSAGGNQTLHDFFYLAGKSDMLL